jgi:hypothetical protein
VSNLTKNCMKNLTLIVLPLLFSLTTIAQRNAVEDIDRENFFRIGAKAGIDINHVPGLTYGQGFNFNYQLGGFMQFNYSKRFGIQPEVNFVQSTSTFSHDLSDVSEDLFYGGPQKNEKLNYLEIPVLLNINVGETRHVKLQVGPAYSTLLGSMPNSEKTGKNIQYSNSELSALGGFWIQLPFINLGARYKYSLGNVYNPVTGEKGKAQAIEVFTGFTF